jgi:hypothetical protein
VPLGDLANEVCQINYISSERVCVPLVFSCLNFIMFNVGQSI